MIGNSCARRMRREREEGRVEGVEREKRKKRNYFCDCVECESFPLMDA
jgi:hypothetical protein